MAQAWGPGSGNKSFLSTQHNEERDRMILESRRKRGPKRWLWPVAVVGAVVLVLLVLLVLHLL